MVRRIARLLAPIAIIAVAVSVYLVVHGTVDNHNTVTQNAVNAPKHHHHRHRHSRKPKYYVVKPGDTLSAIATRTGVSLTVLEQLNPNISPNALQTGKRLRLRR
ncbi:MAG: LysM peptidoglycan-binding domain-containing protein [Solirubrobacteraceae bacterium]